MIVKIGVALSGCDIGGVAAGDALWELREQGFGIEMISCCGVPSVTALLFAAGYPQEGSRRLARRFLRTAREVDIDMAVAEFAAALRLGRGREELPVVVSGVNVADGGIRAFTKQRFGGEGGGRLRRYPLDDIYDALSATISPVEGLASYLYDGNQLCDFSVWYGVPVYPLKLTAVEKTVSIAFLPRAPRTPYEVMVGQRIAASAHLADIHIPIAVDSGCSAEEYAAAAVEEIRANKHALFGKMLFAK